MFLLRCVHNHSRSLSVKNLASFSSLAKEVTSKNVIPNNTTVSVVRHPFPIDGTPLKLDKESATNDLFAVVEFSGTQFKVTKDDVIVADKIPNIDIDDVIDMNKVLLVGNRSNTIIGRPLIPGAQVLAVVEEITKDKKVITLKVRRRKNSKNIKGFRRQVTILRIKDIILSNETAGDMGVI